MRPRDGAHHTTAVRIADLLQIDALGPRVRVRVRIRARVRVRVRVM